MTGAYACIAYGTFGCLRNLALVKILEALIYIQLHALKKCSN